MTDPARPPPQPSDNPEEAAATTGRPGGIGGADGRTIRRAMNDRSAPWGAGGVA